MQAFITLLPECEAKIGASFRFIGLPPSCKRCKLYALCSRLRKGLVYTVIEVRNTRHTCSLHGKVVAVKVRLEPIEMLVPAKFAIEGIKFSYSPTCTTIECPYFNLCNPLGLREGDYLKILKIFKERSVSCKGEKLIAVLAEVL